MSTSIIYTVYCSTNLINQKIYIGVHKTQDINDDYLGSGSYFNRALNKYGKESFKKEILFQFDNSWEAYAKESEIVSRRFLKRKDVYNLSIGGIGGWSSFPNNKLKDICRKGGNTRHINSIELGKRISIGLKNSSKGLNGVLSIQEKYPYGTWYGKRHTEETKIKIAEKNSIYQKGSKNSQYGTCWIYNLKLKQNKKFLKKILINGYLVIG